MDVPLGPSEEYDPSSGETRIGRTPPRVQPTTPDFDRAMARQVPASSPIPPVLRKRLLLADDQELFLDGLTRLLETEYDVVATTSKGHELVSLAREHTPDLIVTDDSMSDLPGLGAITALRDAAIESKVVLLSTNEEGEYAAEALNEGVRGYVVKRSASSELLSALREALEGSLWVSPTVAAPLILHQKKLLDALGESEHEVVASLSDRQQRIVQLIASGKIAKEIAQDLGISRKTVEYHKYKVMKRLGLSSTAELIRFAVRHGLDGDDE